MIKINGSILNGFVKLIYLLNMLRSITSRFKFLLAHRVKSCGVTTNRIGQKVGCHPSTFQRLFKRAMSFNQIIKISLIVTISIHCLFQGEQIILLVTNSFIHELLPAAHKPSGKQIISGIGHIINEFAKYIGNIGKKLSRFSKITDNNFPSLCPSRSDRFIHRIKQLSKRFNLSSGFVGTLCLSLNSCNLSFIKSLCSKLSVCHIACKLTKGL